MHDTQDSDRSVAEEKREALSLVGRAFAEGRLDGLDPDCLVQAALFTAFQELVTVYGEEATARYAEGLPDRIRTGGYTIAPRH
jgi:hypothetical protein